MTQDKKSPYKLIQWDIDGTLVGSEMRNRHAIEQVSYLANVIIDEHDWIHLCGKAEEDIYIALVNDNHENKTNMQSIYKTPEDFRGACQYAYKQFMNMVSPIQATANTFHLFNELGIPQQAISNSLSSSVHASLEHINFQKNLFDEIICKGDITRIEEINGKKEEVIITKPDPEPLHIGRRRLNKKFNEKAGDHDNFVEHVRIEDVLFIGDSKTDVAAALRAGCDIIHLIDEGKEVGSNYIEKMTQTHGTSSVYRFMKRNELINYVRNHILTGKRIESSYPKPAI